MPSTVPLTFSASPLPVNFSGTLQELFDAFTERLSADSANPYSLFVSGSIAPSTNQGPWLKDGIVWYVWNDILGQYVPATLDDVQRKFVASSSAPDPADFTLWVEVVAGVAKSIKYYSGGSWVDIYNDKFALYTTTANLPAAISVQTNQYPFRASKQSAPQTITAGAGDTMVTFDAEDFDPSNVFSGNKFTAPIDGYYHLKASAFLYPDTGTPTVIDRQIKLRIGGSQVTKGSQQVNDLTGAVTLVVDDVLYMTAGQQADVAVQVTTTGASTWLIDNDSSTGFFNGFRVIA